MQTAACIRALVDTGQLQRSIMSVVRKNGTPTLPEAFLEGQTVYEASAEDTAEGGAPDMASDAGETEGS